MNRSSKTPFFLIIVLLIVMAGVSYFAYESYRNVDCVGVSCKEGEFCQDNSCKAISPPITNKYM